jgi:hypothetical protein
LKKIYTGVSDTQTPFELFGENEYTSIEDIFSVFSKDELDDLENIAFGNRDPKDGNLTKGEVKQNQPHENYIVAKRDLELELDRKDNLNLTAETIEDAIDEYQSSTKEFTKIPVEQIPLLKQDLISKYLGTDND